jgi:hypothetical protein
LSDLLAVTWIVASVWLAMSLRDAILTLRAPGQRLIEAGEGLQHTFASTAQAASRVPFVGNDLAGALGRGTEAGQVMISAGHSQITAVEYSAIGLAVAVIVLLGLLPVLRYWLPSRLRYVRAATAAAAMRTQAPELLALRALTGLPIRRLLGVCTDPAGDWRRGQQDAIDRLAALQLASFGLRPAQPRPETQSGSTV